MRNASLCSNMTWQHSYVNTDKGLKMRKREFTFNVQAWTYGVKQLIALRSRTLCSGLPQTEHKKLQNLAHSLEKKIKMQM